MRTHGGIRLWMSLAVLAALAGTAPGQEAGKAAGPEAAPDKSYMPGVGEQLETMRKAMQKQQEELDAVKTQLGTATGDRDAIERQREMIANMIKAETGKLTEGWGWVSNWVLKGDFRYRTEWINSGAPGQFNDRTRQRIRVRLGMFGKVNDEFDVGLQLATSEPGFADARLGGDPASTNQTETNWFDKKPVYFDKMYATYQPKAVPGLKATVGKMDNPFYRVGGNQLIWDSDLTPEGMAVAYQRKLGDDFTMSLNGGGFWVVERNQRNAAGTIPAADTGLFGVQGVGRMELPHVADKLYALAGLSYYRYTNIEYYAPRAALGNNLRGGNYASGFQIINPFVEAGMPIMGLPVAAYADFAYNPSADTVGTVSDNETAWLVGFSVGKCKDPGSWEVSYDYRQMQPDSVLGQFSDSDFAGGGSNAKGHRVGLTYQLAKNVQVGVAYFCDQLSSYTPAVDESFYHRFQFDVMLKF